MSGKSNILQVFRFLAHLVAPGPGMVGVAHAVNAFGGFAELAWRGHLLSFTTNSCSSQSLKAPPS
jgi:predicted ATPase